MVIEKEKELSKLRLKLCSYEEDKLKKSKLKKSPLALKTN
jgi:hypothetical protein